MEGSRGRSEWEPREAMAIQHTLFAAILAYRRAEDELKKRGAYLFVPPPGEKTHRRRRRHGKC